MDACDRRGHDDSVKSHLASRHLRFNCRTAQVIERRSSKAIPSVTPGHTPEISRLVLPELCLARHPHSMRGRREDRMPTAPAASCVKVKNTRVIHHRYAEAFRPSLRNGLNGLLRALPGDRALLPPCPRVMRRHHHELSASVGAPGPHGFAVRKTSFVRIRERMLRNLAAIAARLRVRDDRETPLCMRRDARQMQLIWGKEEARYF